MDGFFVEPAFFTGILSIADLDQNKVATLFENHPADASANHYPFILSDPRDDFPRNLRGCLGVLECSKHRQFRMINKVKMNDVTLPAVSGRKFPSLIFFNRLPGRLRLRLLLAASNLGNVLS